MLHNNGRFSALGWFLVATLLLITSNLTTDDTWSWAFWGSRVLFFAALLWSWHELTRRELGYRVSVMAGIPIALIGASYAYPAYLAMILEAVYPDNRSDRLNSFIDFLKEHLTQTVSWGLLWIGILLIVLGMAQVLLTKHQESKKVKEERKLDIKERQIEADAEKAIFEAKTDRAKAAFQVIAAAANNADISEVTEAVADIYAFDSDDSAKLPGDIVLDDLCETCPFVS